MKREYCEDEEKKAKSRSGWRKTRRKRKMTRSGRTKRKMRRTRSRSGWRRNVRRKTTWKDDDECEDMGEECEDEGRSRQVGRVVIVV